MNGTTFTHDPVEEFAAEIARLSPGDLELVYPLGSGSEAIEAALKLARQYWVESGKRDKRKLLTLMPSYHGNTLLALSASARPHYSTLFKDWMVEVVRVPAPYAYRCACRGTPPYCDACSGAAIEMAIIAAGPESVAAFVGEPVGGSSTGASVPPPEYWPRVREICDRYDVLLIADEVLSGAGRTGTWSALEPYGVVPDIMTLGKGIAGGYVPLSAVVTTRAIADVIAHGTGALAHAQTFSHHPVLCAAGVATLRYLRERRLIERCAEMGPVLQRRLADLRDAAARRRRARSRPPGRHRVRCRSGDPRAAASQCRLRRNVHPGGPRRRARRLAQRGPRRRAQWRPCDAGTTLHRHRGSDR